MNITGINRLLARENAGYSARFVRSDDPASDDDIEILLHGSKTRWNVQVGHGYAGVNEYGFENGQLEWVKDHGIFRSVSAAVARLSAVLRATEEV